MNVIAFDIETVPDTAGFRRLQPLEGLTDDDAARVMFQQRRQETGGSEFLRPHQHRIVAIAVAGRLDGDFRVWSLGDEASAESELVRRFFDGIERYAPVLVSWNGSGFDLPVLVYRALFHGIQAPRYWETGDEEQSFRYNNYLNRFHWRHTDLMEVLSGFDARARTKLEDISLMLGLPGKLGMHGGLVWDAWQEGRVAAIRAYCETDALNTWLVYQRFEFLRGRIDARQLAEHCEEVAGMIEASGRGHLQQFLAGWDRERYTVSVQ